MATRHPLRAALEALVGVVLCIVALPVSVYAFALASAVVGRDMPCTDGYWCPTAVENTVAGVSLVVGGVVAVVLLVVGGVRLARGDGPRLRAWLLAGAGVLVTLDLAYGALVYAGAEGAFS